VQGGALDDGYLNTWAASLNVQRELDDIRVGRIKPKTT
jgi:hypothetical protein